MDRQKKQSSANNSIPNPQGNAVQTMTTYAYLKHSAQQQSDIPHDDAELLNNFGAEGWKLVQVLKEPTGYYTKYEYYFIREK